jgi:hypothetical protein
MVACPFVGMWCSREAVQSKLTNNMFPAQLVHVGIKLQNNHQIEVCV